jgi:hypothetical protein
MNVISVTIVKDATQEQIQNEVDAILEMHRLGILKEYSDY